jgi:2-polyprenyl-6-hydroxyphenyl methylase/3-demethylubiquinone-9 3-methyltransferase
MALSHTADHAHEVIAGERFEFGRNWSRFLHTLTPERVQRAETALQTMLGRTSLDGLTMLDLGSGSGLSSLAAHRLGARVTSVDYDPHSVECTAQIRRQFGDGGGEWRVLEGSALDRAFLERLGTFDIVYSWGVLHHTGDMWGAFANVVPLVAPEGILFLSIYNDQGAPSVRWLRVKQLYNRLPGPLRQPLLWACFVKLWWRRLVKDALKGHPLRPIRSYGSERGMSFWTDLVDWVGGYPFQVAKPEEVFNFFRDRGFRLERLTTNAGSLGCNEYVFVRTGEAARPSVPQLAESAG